MPRKSTPSMPQTPKPKRRGPIEKAKTPELAPSPVTVHLAAADSEEDGDDGDADGFVDATAAVVNSDGAFGQFIKDLAAKEHGGDIKKAIQSLRLSKSTMKTYNYEFREFNRSIFAKAGLAFVADDFAGQVAAIKEFVRADEVRVSEYLYYIIVHV